MTTEAGNGDKWIAKRSDDSVVSLQTTELAARISEAIIAQVVPE